MDWTGLGSPAKGYYSAGYAERGDLRPAGRRHGESGVMQKSCIVRAFCIEGV
jgi:hypothetical protein